MAVAYPDTSFLFSLYLPRTSSVDAARVFSELDGPLPVSSLLLFEFENAVRLATWLHGQDKCKGFPVQLAQTALARLDSDLDDGALELVFCDYGLVVDRARKISNTHTWRTGHRSIDVLHVATARYLRARRFLTFDDKQRKLAEAEGLLPL
ncbi:MAG: PIN domain-containing protein [Verrucomicrobia bacterium]|nr:PIN domain-containing protein [Verrucomicrobiota bacterium]